LGEIEGHDTYPPENAAIGVARLCASVPSLHCGLHWNDFVAVPSNPLDDITVMEGVAWVMKSGIVVKPLP
jgi:hypothetical protein